MKGLKALSIIAAILCFLVLGIIFFIDVLGIAIPTQKTLTSLAVIGGDVNPTSILHSFDSISTALAYFKALALIYITIVLVLNIVHLKRK
jgi:hypothetical protein